MSVTTHAFAHTSGRSYLDFYPNRRYIKRYMHVSRHWRGWHSIFWNDIIDFVVVVSVPVIATGVFLYDTKRYLPKLQKTSSENSWHHKRLETYQPRRLQ